MIDCMQGIFTMAKGGWTQKVSTQSKTRVAVHQAMFPSHSTAGCNPFLIWINLNGIEIRFSRRDADGSFSFGLQRTRNDALLSSSKPILLHPQSMQISAVHTLNRRK